MPLQPNQHHTKSTFKHSRKTKNANKQANRDRVRINADTHISAVNKETEKTTVHKIRREREENVPAKREILNFQRKKKMSEREREC